MTLSQFSDGTSLIIGDSDIFYFAQNGTEYRMPFSTIKSAFGNVMSASLSIPTASVLTLNATPLEIVAAPGAGYAIQVISASYKLTYNSVAYATNTTLQLICKGASIPQKSSGSAALAATTTQISHINSDTNPTAGNTQIVENAELQVKVATGNPTAGNSDIKVYVLYRLITL
jgi:hypothetical protein